MKWRVVIRPEVEQDVANAASWYNSREPGLGVEFVEDIISVWDALEENPFLNSRRHQSKNVRWRYPLRFPYRVIYEIVESEQTVIVAAVLHAAQDDWLWQQRLEL